ncbi:MAG: hypothetical protein M9955_23485 [Rhizobiaceae bacterium]|jgi:transcription elongation factor Elf1|nr:hypothetical protein [Rhizobiaceae bacterium]
MAEVRPLVLKCPSCATMTVETPIDVANLDFIVKCTSCGKEFGRWEQVQAAFAAKAKR